MKLKDYEKMTMEEYDKLSEVTAKYPRELLEGFDSNLLGKCYVALGLAEEAGEVAGKIKKMIRDDRCVVTEDRRQAIKKELGDVFWYLFACCREWGFDPADVAMANVEKLYSRLERGTIHGEGDDR